MSRFLSPEWMNDLTRAAAGDPALGAAASGVSLCLQQVVRHPDGTLTTYALRIDGGVVEVVPGHAEHPDVTLSEDYATAVALALGELSPQAALLAGRVVARGDPGALVAGQAALALAQVCFDRVRAETVF